MAAHWQGKTESANVTAGVDAPVRQAKTSLDGEFHGMRRSQLQAGRALLPRGHPRKRDPRPGPSPLRLRLARPRDGYHEDVDGGCQGDQHAVRRAVLVDEVLAVA